VNDSETSASLNTFGSEGTGLRMLVDGIGRGKGRWLLLGLSLWFWFVSWRKVFERGRVRTRCRLRRRRLGVLDGFDG
jgi:hypothetical protein